MIRTSLVLLGLTAFAGAQAGLAPAQPSNSISPILANSNGGGGSPCATVCQSANTTCTTGWGAGNTNTFALIMTAGASGDNVCGFSVWTKNTVASSVSCFVHLADTAGLPISPAAGTGTMAVGTTYGKYSVTLGAPVAVPAGARYFIAFDNTGMEHPICGAGGTQVSYYWHPPVWTTWNGTFTNAWVYEVDCCSGCPAANTGCTTGYGVGNTNTFALQLTAGASGDNVRGFSLWTKNATPSSVNCYLHLADGSGLPISPAARTGTMSVGTVYGKYSVSLNAPIAVAAGATYFIAFDNGGMDHPICTAGGATQTSYYWHPPVWTTWNGIFTQAWAYEVDCRRCAAAAIRNFYGTGCGSGPLGVGNTHTLPQLGQNGDLLMRFGPPSGPGVFLIGAVQTATSLAGIGMPGCTLYTNPLVSLGTSFTAGNATPVPFNIPNELFLCGGSLYVTGAAVWIGQNPLGVITSNAIQLTVGN